MQRRQFLISLGAFAALSLSARADENELTIGIYPGTGKADIPEHEFLAAAKPFARALGASLGVDARLVLFRSIRNTLRSLEKGRLDLYFVPPTVAVSVLDNNYSPVARVRDQANGTLVRRTGATVTTVALTEKESWLDVMGRYTLKRNKQNVTLMNLKTQEEVALAMKRGLCEAGSLRSKLASELTATGEYENWLPLPNTPDFTLMASDRLTQPEQDKLGVAASTLGEDVIKSLQKTIHSKVTGFVIDKNADYKTIKAAMADYQE